MSASGHSSPSYSAHHLRSSHNLFTSIIRRSLKSHTSDPRICPMNPEDLQRLVTLQMPYGKYKGRVLADLPGHYLGWFAREGFPKGDLGRLLELMYELDHNALRTLLDPLRQR